MHPQEAIEESCLLRKLVRHYAMFVNKTRWQFLVHWRLFPTRAESCAPFLVRSIWPGKTSAFCLQLTVLASHCFVRDAMICAVGASDEPSEMPIDSAIKQE